MAHRSLVALILTVLPAVLAAQQPIGLDIPSIMRGPETVGREPAQVRWSPDSRWIYFSWLPPGTDWRETSKPYRIRAVAGAQPERISESHADSVAPILANGERTRDGRRRYVSSNGDLWVVELPSGAARRLTRTTATEQVAALSTDEQMLYFTQGGNVYALTLASGFVEQLTDIRTGTAPDTARRTAAQRAAIERDQRDLLEVIRDGARADSIRRAQGARRDSLALPTTWLGRDWRLRNATISPTGRHALVVAIQSASPEAKNTIVPNYVTASGYTEDINARSKVGDSEGKQRVGLLTIATGAVQWLRPIPDDSSNTYGSLNDQGWNDAGTAVLLQADTRDYTRRVLSVFDVDAARLTVLEEHVDSAWVGGPCGGCVGWLPGTGGVWFANESSGYAHLYRIDVNGANRRALTSGRWEVLQAALSPSRDQFLLTTNEGSPYEQHFYTMALDGSERTRMSSGVGGHTAQLSPDGRWIADLYSTANRPAELYLQPARAGAPMTQLTTSPTAEWLAQQWIVPEIVEIPGSDGVGVPARIYRPEQFNARANGAAVLFVHGAGYLHNVHNYWSSHYREYQFHHLLASKGYVVLDVDYRGSAGYGRDWRTAIYRHMGGRDLEDFVDASKWLTRTLGIPGDRIGIYGGSYGGFITLMALFTRPEYFGAGAALRSVTDWAHYNHGYTARILNEPQGDTTAYRRSSPIFFAEGLEDPLLIAHGMIDTNVHFQDVVRLAQRLIELGKERWEMALYPVEDHGFVRPDSWTDEYRRILELFDRWLPEARGTRE
jgi:dipeptidyl aminopeptidase/acylaminoacyl peptidase